MNVFFNTLFLLGVIYIMMTLPALIVPIMVVLGISFFFGCLAGYSPRWAAFLFVVVTRAFLIRR